MKFKIALLGLLSVLSAPAYAQSGCSGQPASGYVCGNGQASAGLPGFYSQTTLLDRGFGSGQGTVLNRTVSGWLATVAPSLGVNGGTGGSITLNGSTSGSATISVPAAAGSVTFKLPSSNGLNNQVLTTDGSGNLSWVSLTGTGTVTSVGLSMPGIFSVTGSPVTTSGTLTASLANQSANLVWAGPSTGVAAAPTFRSLVGADLPNPSSSTLGGIQSYAGVSSQWIRSISTSGVPASSQPAFSDISGTLAPTQCPASGLATLGCVNAINATASQWLRSLSTSGVFTSSQPTFADIAGAASLSQIQSIGNNTIIGNDSGGTAVPSTLSASNVLDMIGSTRGSVTYRGASAWAALTPGTSGQVLTSNGAGADPSWSTITGTGTVTSVGSGTGLTGGPITTTGTLSLAPIATGNVLANVSGISAAPSATTPSAVLDVIGSTQGNILYRAASNWSVLAPGTSGQVLQTNGAGSSPSWANVGSVSNVTISAGAKITTSGTCNISSSGTCTVTVEQGNPGGRLTLVSGTPVFTTDQAGATTIYYAPYVGKYVPIYNGTAMQSYAFTASDSDTVGLSIALGSNWAANTIYDVFIGLNSSTVTLCTGPAWTASGAGSSSRGTGAGTTQLALFKGVQTNAVSLTCRYNNTTTFTCAANQCTYVGSFITNGSTGQIDFKFGSAASGGGAACLCVYNAYNQVAQTAAVRDSVTTYTYTTASYRQANASTGNQVNFLVGLAGNAVTIVNSAQTFNSSGGVVASVGIGIDSTTANSAQIQMAAQAPASTSAVTTATYAGNPAIGFHYAARLEYSQAAGTTTWDGTGGATGIQSGETFQWLN